MQLIRSITCCAFRSYNQVNDHCYQLHHSAVTWQEAKTTCADGLLYLHDLEELDFLKQRIFEPQAERGIIWLAARKDVAGLI